MWAPGPSETCVSGRMFALRPEAALPARSLFGPYLRARAFVNVSATTCRLKSAGVQSNRRTGVDDPFWNVPWRPRK